MPPCTVLLLRLSLCLCLCCLIHQTVNAQIDSLVNNNKVSSLTTIDNKTINGLSKEYGSLQSKLEKKSSKLLSKMQSKENKLQKKLRGKDSTKANELFTSDIKDKYAELQSKLTDKTKTFKKFPLQEYVPGLDSMQTSLSFLLKNKSLPNDKMQQIKGLSDKLKGLQGQLQKANDIQSFVKEREVNLKEQLLNSGLAKQLKGVNKQAYYYQEQLSEYKALLNDKQKLQEKVLQTVRALPAFKKFWQKNSYLASLFPEPSTNSAGQAIAGLQTRASVQNLIAQRMGTAATTTINGTTEAGNSASPQQFIQQQISSAQEQLSQLKNKLNNLSMNGGSSDMTMPDFKPNEQKTKSLLQRLEYGFNVQSEQSRYYLPTTSDPCTDSRLQVK